MEEWLDIFTKIRKIVKSIYFWNKRSFELKPMLKEAKKESVENHIEICFGKGEKKEYLTTITLKNKGDIFTIKAVSLNGKITRTNLDIYQEDCFSLELYLQYDNDISDRELLDKCQIIIENKFKIKYIVFVNIEENITPKLSFKSNNDIIPFYSQRISWWKLLILKHCLKKSGELLQKKEYDEEIYEMLLEYITDLRFISKGQIRKVSSWIDKYLPDYCAEEFKLVAYLNDNIKQNNHIL